MDLEVPDVEPGQARERTRSHFESVAQEEMLMEGDFTEQRTDMLLVKFEKRIDRLKQNLDAKVRRNAAEKDVLKCAGVVRDLLSMAASGEKAMLEEIFGGSCRRFHRFNNVMEGIEFSAANKKDTRWQEVKEKIGTIESLLREFGSFKPWVQTAAPTDISYKIEGGEIPEWLGDDIELEFVCIVEGAEPDTMFYRISPALPEGMSLDRDTGSLKGKPLADCEVPITTYTITGENAAGTFIQTVTFGVKPAEPKSVAYDISEKVCVGTHFLWIPESTGGKVKEYSVVPELPRGLTLDPESGIIFGTPMVETEAQEYTVTATNKSGSARAVLDFEVSPAPPVSIKYNDVAGADFNVGVNLYIMPEVELASISPEESVRGVVPAGDLAELARTSSRAGQKIPRRVSAELAGVEMRMGHQTSILSSMSYSSVQPSWGRRHSESGAFQGTRWTKARNPLWEALIVNGMQPNITFLVSPELPAGLSLSRTTGVISGRPTQKVPRMLYTVTASNDSGSCSTGLNFGIVLVPPKALEYPDVPSVIYEAVPVSLTPELDGTVSMWSVSPELPPGMIFDKEMGTIGGVPSGAHPRAEYQVTARNDAGQVTTTVTFVVQRQAPVRLVYSPLRLEYPWDIDLTLRPQSFTALDTPAYVETYSVLPDLPVGLALDESTGVISGRPAEVTPVAAFTLRAANESGQCEATLTFQIKELPTKGLSYPGIDEFYGVGDEVDEVAVVQGGATTWSVEPPLPKGLALDPATGRIHGVAEEITPDTSYNITASNNAGGTSVLVEFEITAPPPKKLTYPEIGNALQVGASVLADPVVLPAALGCRFTVDPPLPTGLHLNEVDGRITGMPKDPADKRTYVVTAKNRVGSTECNLEFECLEAPDSPFLVDQFFAASLEEVTDVTQMPAPPLKEKRMADWMVWMVHRAWLNDPKLTTFDFSNMQMPLPTDEPRIQSKLMKALACNSHITSLLLQNSNLRNPQALMMGESLRVNRTLEVINLEGNWIEPDGVLAIAVALRESPDVPLQMLRVSNQQWAMGRGDNFGRQCEEAIATMLENNDSITKVGFFAVDPHWNNQIVDKLLRNAERQRRRRKQALGLVSEEVKLAVAKPLTKVVIETPPDKAVWEVFDDDNAHFRILRDYLAGKRRMPTRDQLQAFARSRGAKLKYGEVAPLLKNFRTGVFANIVGQSVTCTDDLRNEYSGKLRSVKEKNERVNLDVTSDGGRWDFGSVAQPVIEVSKEVAEWFVVQEDADGEGATS